MRRLIRSIFLCLGATLFTAGSIVAAPLQFGRWDCHTVFTKPNQKVQFAKVQIVTDGPVYVSGDKYQLIFSSGTIQSSKLKFKTKFNLVVPRPRWQDGAAIYNTPFSVAGHGYRILVDRQKNVAENLESIDIKFGRFVEPLERNDQLQMENWTGRCKGKSK